MVAFLAGEVSAMFGGSSAAPHVRAGRLRALALAGKRNPAYPDLPALSEFYPGVELTPWLGLFAPAGLPGPVLGRVRKETGRLLADPATRERVQSISLDLFVTTPQEFAVFVRAEHKKYGELVKAARVTID
jgi:tripartite-type tricarboxylate transporter receptor subunit TctC